MIVNDTYIYSNLRGSGGEGVHPTKHAVSLNIA